MNRSREDVSFEINELYCIVCEHKMDWSDETREWICPECGNRAFQTYDCGEDEIYFEHSPEDDYDEYYGEEDSDEYYDPEDMSPDKDGFEPKS